MSRRGPSLVLIAGSWHQGKCYDRIIKLLTDKHGLKCTSVTLPSTQGDTESTFKDDIDAASDAIVQETSQGLDVVVIAHSFGGMVGNSAIKGLSRPKKAKTESGSVIGLILIASGFTLTGLAFMDPLFGIPPPSWRINKDTGFADLVAPPREFFYHDLSDEDANYWVSQLTSQNLKAMFEGGEHAYAGWKDVPTWYIGTIEDRGLPVMVQRVQVGMARAMGGEIEHRELKSSHSPFLSMPAQCVGLLLDALEAFTGEHFSTDRDHPGPKRGGLIRPAVNLLHPTSWIRYGLPLGLGYTVGSCISIFAWFRYKLMLWNCSLRT